MASAGLTEGEKEEGVKAKEALNEDGEGSDDEGDTRKAATYGNKKNEVCPCCNSFHLHASPRACQLWSECVMHHTLFLLHFCAHAAHTLHCKLYVKECLQLTSIHICDHP